MKSRTISALAVTIFGLALLTSTSPAQAQTAGSCVSTQYPPGSTILQVSSSLAVAGGQIDVTGCGAVNGQVTFTLLSDPKNLGSATTDGTGFYRARLTIPCDVDQGTHTLTASGAANNSARLTVSGVSANCTSALGNTTGGSGSTGRLVRTGSSSIVPMTVAGFALVAFGAAAVLAARKRRAVRTTLAVQ